MTKSTTNHITLNVPIDVTSINATASNLSCNRLSSFDRSIEKGDDELTISKQQSSLATTRRSLKRTWNQLPRLQRNLIILGVSATCITIMLLLPGEHLDRKRGKDHSNASVMNLQESLLHHLPLYVNNDHDNALEETPTLSEKKLNENHKRALKEFNLKSLHISNRLSNNNKEDQIIFSKDFSANDKNNFNIDKFKVANLFRKSNKRYPSEDERKTNLDVRTGTRKELTGSDINNQNMFRRQSENKAKFADSLQSVYFNDNSDQKTPASQFNHLSNLQLPAMNENQNKVMDHGGLNNQVNKVERIETETMIPFPVSTSGLLSTGMDNQWAQDRSTIENLIKNPYQVPVTVKDHLNDKNLKLSITINDFVDSLDSKLLPQKQHFHGANNLRQEAVVKAFRHSWSGYKKFAWGHDNLKPLSESSHDWFGLGLTMIDSLDTMYIMGLDDEFFEAQKWVEDSLHFNINRDVNLFEVTIRVLGGLLSAYHLSGEKMFLKKSIELANRLMPCFLSPSGIPYSDVNLSAMLAHAPKWSPDSSTSEVSTIQMEFRDLSRLTNISLYERVSHRVNEKIHVLEKKNGLVPIFINANTGMFRNYATISLGARGDSYYEYLIKQWLQTGRKPNDFLLSDYIRAIDGVFSQLLRRTAHENLVFIGELINGKEFKPKMDHLTCYLPGTLLLGHHFGLPDSHILLARDLLDTCYKTYQKQPTYLAPEITYFVLNENKKNEFSSNGDLYVKPNDAHNLLRPEFIESLYYFYALTGNHTYQDLGWTIFQSFEKYTKVNNGYTSIGNVKNTRNTRLRDMMESFWLGETLKYFYLLFSNNPKEIDLEKWVFNTEAHLLPLRKF